MARSARKDQKQDININLIPQQEMEGALGQGVHWVLTVGRYLIIITEIIALAAFGISLKLTIDKNELNKRIEYAQEVVDSKQDFEKEFREVQNKISSVKKIRLEHFDNHLLITEFNKLLPKGISLTNLDINQTELSFSGSFPTAAQLHTLINSFNNSDKLVALDISELKSPSVDDPEFTFTASAIVNTSAFAESETNKSEVTK
jgi:Tfp pilus assembly protein PilN